MSIGHLSIQIPLKADTVNTFQYILEALNQKKKDLTANDIGINFANFSNNILDEVFGNMLKHMGSLGYNTMGEDKETLQEVSNAFSKYMPWAIGRFSLDRLKPLVDYYTHLIQTNQDGNHQLVFPISHHTSVRIVHMQKQLAENNQPSNKDMMNMLIHTIDDSLEYLLLKPKKTLQFNIIVDKTLNGVISLTSKLAYRQLNKTADRLSAPAALEMTNYMLNFIKKDS